MLFQQLLWWGSGVQWNVAAGNRSLNEWIKKEKKQVMKYEFTGYSSGRQSGSSGTGA